MAEIQAALAAAEQQYQALAAQQLALDLTRGKPGPEQLGLSDAMDGILDGDYRSASGVDVRNYGGLEGLVEAREFFGGWLDANTEETLAGGNSSLTLMYTVMDLAMNQGLRGLESAWGNADVVKFLCPVPGYDRHFAICEHLGIEMITVPLLDSGPDMDEVEKLVQSDPAIKGIWCVPRFSNPTGCVYSADTVQRIARLPALASDNFIVMWDNAYAVHSLSADATTLPPLWPACREAGTCDGVFMFGSTSKVTHAGAGVAFLASSPDNLAALTKHQSYSTIGPDKINQLRHLRFLQDDATVARHMAAHADIIRPRFEAVLSKLEAELAGEDMGTWTRPEGGYFISFDAPAGTASEIVKLAADIGVKLTPAGATFPYGEDPQDSNIRLAPTFPSLEELEQAMEAFVCCVKLACLRKAAS